MPSDLLYDVVTRLGFGVSTNEVVISFDLFKTVVSRILFQIEICQ